ncbi:MAG: DUF6967 family protein [Gallionellaceae bacterium]
MAQVVELDRFNIPLGGQEVELQQIDHVNDGMSLLRIRIREAKRFTVFDVDPVTAKAWGETMIKWAEAQASLADDN